MTGILKLTWYLRAADPPRLLRHCPGCHVARPFRCSGKVRLNANGRRLDAWLVYKCVACDRTWNLAVFDRAALGTVSRADLSAMQQNDPDWIAERAMDSALLRRAGASILADDRSRIEGPAFPDVWTVVDLTLVAATPHRERLDRLLARVLRMSRSDLAALAAKGGLTLEPPAALNRPVTGETRLRLVAAALTDAQRLALRRGDASA